MVFAAVWFGFVLLAPIAANAASPVVDNFDSGFSGWSNSYGWSNSSWDNTPGDCWVGNCVKDDTFNTQYYNYKIGTPLNSGAFIIYFRNQGYTGGMFTGVCTDATSGTGCQGGGSVGGTLGMITNDVNYQNDSTWHYTYFAWQDGASHKEWCELLDDNNPAHCSWNTTTIANGTTYSGVVFGNYNGINLGASLRWDELGVAPITPTGYTVTQFIQLYPASTTVATGTPVTVGAQVFVAPRDWQPGMFLQLAFANQTQTNATGFAADAFNQIANTIDLPIDASNTVLTLSTTTEFSAIGTTIEYEKIETTSWLSSLPLIGNLFEPAAVIASSTSFTVDHMTGIDQIVASSTALVSSIYSGGSLSFDLQGCSIGGSFNLAQCVVSLVVPSNNDLNNDYNAFYNAFATKFPWGYVTRFVTIFSNNATSTVPLGTITAGFYISSTTKITVLNNFSLDDMVTGGAALINSAPIPGGETTDTLQSLVEPWVELFVALFVVFIIVRDLLKIGAHQQPHGKLH